MPRLTPLGLWILWIDCTICLWQEAYGGRQGDLESECHVMPSNECSADTPVRRFVLPYWPIRRYCRGPPEAATTHAEPQFMYLWKDGPREAVLARAREGGIFVFSCLPGLNGGPSAAASDLPIS